MRTLITILIVMFELRASAQTPTTDSIRTFVDKYIGSSIIHAFTNGRVNTTLNWMLNRIDSADSKTIMQDIDIADSTKGVILKSPSGQRFRLKVNDQGELTTEQL